MNKKTKFKQTEIGMIPEDWNISKLRDLGELKNGVNFNRGDFGKGLPVINVTNLFRGRYATIENLDEIKKESIPNYHKYLVKKGDILFARSSLVHSGAGQAAMLKNLDSEYIFSGFIIRFRKFERVILDYDFLNYLVRSELYRKYFTMLLDGTTITNINQQVLSNIPIILPPITEQESISKILSDLDSKIELNQQMNKTLEAIGQSIFKKWFIDFEFPNEKGKPYKSSGGEMVFNEKLGKDIPKGWEVGSLGDYINFIKGKKPFETSEEFKVGYLPQILIENLDGRQPVYANTEKMVIVEETEPIMVMDGASSGRIEIGHCGILGSTLAKVIVKNKLLTNSYLLHFLKIYQKDINQNTTGTSIPHTDKEKIIRYGLALPNKRLLELFDEFAIKILYKIIKNKEEIQNLSQIRDSLLPRLMSGKIRVPVAIKA